MPAHTSSTFRYRALCAALSVVATSAVAMTLVAMQRAVPALDAGSSRAAANITQPAKPASGAAEQLRRRLASNGNPVPPLALLDEALDERKALLSRVTTASIVSDGTAVATERIALYDASDWLVLRTTAFSASYDIDEGRAAVTLRERFADALGRGSVVAAADAVPHDNDRRLLRTTLAERPSEGYSVDWDAAARTVREALLEGDSSVAIAATHEPASVTIRDASGATLTLTLLSTGKSNFAKSPWGREVNVRKGLEERVNGTIVPQGVSFSFNDAIGPMTASRGWKEALGIFEGVNLKPIVGGGICQVATTVYRAALLAGLPIDSRKNHSLYVTYYKEHGVGLDATVFPGKQDLAFRNDTPGPLFIESWTTDDDEGIVRIYGIPDGRGVALDGPYYSATAPEDLRVTLRDGTQRPLKKNEIAWVRTVTMADGTVLSEPVVSAYNSVPKSLVAEALAAQEAMHAAAPPEGSL